MRRPRHTCHPYRATLFGLTFLTVPVGTALLVGCGSGSAALHAPAPAPSGRAVLTIRWPERSASRLIPFAANSILIKLVSSDGTRSLGNAVIVRPANGGTVSASFDRLPVGPLTVLVSAFPTADGTGIAQAQATANVAVVAGQVVDVRLTLASTIDRLELTPSTVSLNVGQTVAVTPVAKNDASEIILTSSATLSWTSEQPSVATVDAMGLIKAVRAGTASVRVMESESGKAGVVTVSVTDPNAIPALVYDGFNYTPGTTLTGQNGGTGWTGVWSSHGPGTPSAIVSGGLSFGNLAVSGNAFRTTSFQPIGDERNWGPTVGTPGTTRYWSILMKPEAVSGGSPDSYFGFGIANQFFGKGGRQVPLGIEQAGGGNFVSAGVNPQANTTYFVVVRASFTATSDTYDLFVNPVPGQPLPVSSSVSKTVAHGSFDPPGFGCGGSVPVVYDELRFGTTWESVSPTIP